jgi:hypothetical protein
MKDSDLVRAAGMGQPRKLTGTRMTKALHQPGCGGSVAETGTSPAGQGSLGRTVRLVLARQMPVWWW